MTESEPGRLEGEAPSRRERIREKARGEERAAKSWGGYGWFMSFGTILPLPTFLLGYLVNVTLIGAPLARQIYRFGIFLSTLGQPPPGEEKLKAKAKAKTGGEGKKPFAERIRPYSPPGLIERRGRPMSMLVRIPYFVLVGWWAGGIWVIIAWSILLLPYPLLDAIRKLLDDLPSVMTLAWPKSADAERAAGVDVPA